MARADTILIHSGLIVDGTGAQIQRADLLIEGERIKEIAPEIKRDKASELIDATGMMLCPGFINVNSASDHYLSIFSDKGQEAFLKQGVTTAVSGLGGSSLAPLMFGNLQAIEKWASANKINVGWQTFEEFGEVLGRIGMGVNFTSFVGHSTIRRTLVGEGQTDLEQRDLEVFQRILQDSLNEGALGLSVGLAYASSHGTSVREIESLIDVLSEKNGILAISPRFDGSGLEEAVEEIVDYADRIKGKVLVNGVLAQNGSELEYRAAIGHLNTRENIYFDTHQFDWQLIPIYFMLPAIFRTGSLDLMLSSIEKVHTLEEVKTGLGKMSGQDYLIAKAPDAEFLTGKTLKEFCSDQGMKIKDGLIELMKVTRMRAILLRKSLNGSEAINALSQYKRCLLGSQAPSALNDNCIFENECISGAFLDFLSKHKEMGFSLVQAVRKLSARPARLLNFKDRGTIEKGNVADLILLSDFEVKRAFVNGQEVLRQGASNSKLAGKILSRV